MDSLENMVAVVLEGSTRPRVALNARARDLFVADTRLKIPFETSGLLRPANDNNRRRVLRYKLYNVVFFSRAPLSLESFLSDACRLVEL